MSEISTSASLRFEMAAPQTGSSPAGPTYRWHRQPAKPLRVLLVDDLDTNLLVLRMMLKRFRISATEAKTGAEALAKLAENRFDLLLLDIELPDMSGYEIAQHYCLEVPEEERGYIVAISGYQRHDIEETCLASGMHACLEKPIRLVQIERLIKQLQPPQSQPSELLQMEISKLNRNSSAATIRALNKAKSVFR